VKLNVVHLAACPEVAPLMCEDVEIAPHVHDLVTNQFQAKLGGVVGLGRGFQLGLNVPLGVRQADVTYTTTDGALYDPPYSDIHHRDEVLWGLNDGTVSMQWFQRLEMWTLGGLMGSTIPLGRTEPDPFAAAEKGLAHQHSQFGSGSPIPILGLQGVMGGAHLGAVASTTVMLPVFENKEGYKAPTTFTSMIGPRWTVRPHWSVLGTTGLIWSGPDSWSGDRHGGRTSLMGNVATQWSVNDSWAMMFEVRIPLWQRLHTEKLDVNGMTIELEADGEFEVSPAVVFSVSRTSR